MNKFTAFLRPSSTGLGRTAAKPAPNTGAQAPGATGAAARKVTVPVQDVAPPAGGFKAHQTSPASPASQASQAALGRAPTARVGVSPLDHFRPGVGQQFPASFDRYIPLDQALAEVADKVAGLPMDNLRPDAAQTVKRSLFIEQALARSQGHPDRVEADTRLQQLLKLQSQLRQEQSDARSAPPPTSVARRNQQDITETELEELPGQIRQARREGVEALAGRLIDAALMARR